MASEVDLTPATILALKDDVAREVTLALIRDAAVNKFEAVDTASAVHNSVAPLTLIAPAAGMALRTVWLYAQATAALGEGTVTVTFTLGTHSYTVELTGSQPFAHGAVWEGNADEALIVTLSGNVEVIVNADYREYAP